MAKRSMMVAFWSAVILIAVGCDADSSLDKALAAGLPRFLASYHKLRDHLGAHWSLNDVPELGTAVTCLVILASLYFFANVMDLILNAKNRFLRVLEPHKDRSGEEPNYFMWRLRDAQEMMVHATRECIMMAVAILVSHVRVSQDIQFSGPEGGVPIGWEGGSEYPPRLETAYWFATGIVIMEYSFVVISFCFAIFPKEGKPTLSKCIFHTAMVMELLMILGEFVSIASIGVLLYTAIFTEGLEGA